MSANLSGIDDLARLPSFGGQMAASNGLIVGKLAEISLFATPLLEMRNPRVKRLLVLRRTQLMVCHAISIAITVVLPAPVASLQASRERPGLAASLAE